MDPSIIEPPATETPSRAAETAPAGPVGDRTRLRTLLCHQLNDLYAAEKDTIQVLGELAGAASSPQLGYLFRLHVTETREQIQRLRQVLEALDVHAGPMRQRGKRGLLEDCVEMASSPGLPGPLRDAALIAVAQHLEHDAIASYDCVCQWAGLLGLRHASGLLALSMAEERRAEARLRRLGETLQGAMLEADATRPPVPGGAKP